MVAKIVNLAEYKAKKLQKELKQTATKADRDIQQALKDGMCDRCGRGTNDLVLLHGQWTCRWCLGL